ncbi:MAG: efflux RND transporter periplasmic adaptor subunit [Blastocatellia bacterium]|nr:MAG: efflux RND transporter periplasmic adaptor subunit [Blastocatellia bacterium]
MSDDTSQQAADAPLAKDQKNKSSRTRSRLVQLASIVGLVLVLVLVWYLLGSKSNQAANRPRAEVVPVEIANASEMDVPVQVKSIGNVESISTIAVRSQVEGTLQAVHFTPGQEVKKGDLLFTIDPRPLQATLAQANANLAKAIAAVSQGKQVLAKDQATASNARTILKRDLTLVESGVISREEYDNALAASEAADATVRADQSAIDSLNAAAKAEQANVRNAQVQLSYAIIKAPIGGKTGNLVVTEGNLVRANDTTPMVTITQAAPIYVTFTVSEPDFLKIRDYSSNAEFRTEVSIPGSSQPAQQGKLSLIDNTVDTSTGTIRLKATFENGDRALYPGLFTNVVLTLGIKHQAVVVPSQAVQIGQDNSFVYTVKADMTVEVRKVQTGSTYEDKVVIEDGLKPGEQVVTDGQLRLVPGAAVQARNRQQKNGPQKETGRSTPDSSGAGTK